jgi:hypothetical protein
VNPQTTTPPAGPVFQCHICCEPSSRICVWCTKDACDNHLCPKCGRCSDCCECEQTRDRAAEEKS